MGDAIFTVDLILLPIYGADVVLGVQWMHQIGPILFDYNQLWMEFTHLAQRICSHGLDRIQFDAMRPASLRKSGTNAAQFYQLMVEPIDRDPNPTIAPNAPIVFLDGLDSIL